MSNKSIYNKSVLCAKCLSPQMRIDTGVYATEGFGQLVCNDCGFKETIVSKEAAQKIMEKAGFGREKLDTFIPKSVMQATICYDSVESASGPMTLGMLYDAVTEALEKGMPKDSEVFESSTEAPIEGVRFLFETEKVGPIECGGHIYPDKSFDLIVDTHVCDETT